MKGLSSGIQGRALTVSCSGHRENHIKQNSKRIKCKYKYQNKFTAKDMGNRPMPLTRPKPKTQKGAARGFLAATFDPKASEFKVFPGPAVLNGVAAPRARE